MFYLETERQRFLHSLFSTPLQSLLDPNVKVIKVTRVPEGPAPEEVRKAWLGTVHRAVDLPQSIPEVVNFATGETVSNRGSVSVPVDEALQTLGRKSPEGMVYFEKHLPNDTLMLNFRKDEVVVLPKFMLLNLMLSSR